MAVNEVNLIMSLFFAQHQGKLVKDVLPDNAEATRTIDTIEDDINCLCVRGNGIQIVWYSKHFNSFRTETTTKGYCDINIMDYITFEDQI